MDKSQVNIVKGNEKKGDSLYLVMPAYNEAATIAHVIETWYNNIIDKSDNSRLVVADSGSTDNTHEILTELQEKLPKLEILTDTAKQHGPKVIALYDYALRNGADYIFQTDSDGQTLPSEFPDFWKRRKKRDAIIGYRPVRGDGVSRAFVEKIVCLMLRIFFSVKVPDANAPFRLMKSELLEKYLYKIPSDYAIPNIILTAYFVNGRENVGFRRITFRERAAGKNSINLKNIISIGIRSIKDFIYFRKDLRR